MIERTLLWTPRAKQRPRTVTHGGRVMTFTPAETRQAEAALAAQWVGPPIEGDIAVTLEMFDDHIDVTIEHAGRPLSPKLRRGDLDNYGKLVLDSLNRVAWTDDRQIADLHMRKM